MREDEQPLRQYMVTLTDARVVTITARWYEERDEAYWFYRNTDEKITAEADLPTCASFMTKASVSSITEREMICEHDYTDIGQGIRECWKCDHRTSEIP